MVADATMIIGAEISATRMKLTGFRVFQEEGGSKDVNVARGMGDELDFLSVLWSVKWRRSGSILRDEVWRN